MKKILIVSSSTSFLERNGTLLRRSDFLIITTTTGSQTLDILNKENIDLIISDIQLEDMEGDRLCELIKKEGYFPGLSLILVCRDTPEDIERLRGCGANALIAKPIKPLQLIQTVGKYLTVVLVRSKRVTLRVKVISKKDAVEFFCLSHNISVTGMMLEAEYRFEIGSIITCLFTIPDSIQVEAEGEIVRLARTIEGSYQYGINFTGLSRTFRHEIDNYIAKVTRAEIDNN